MPHPPSEETAPRPTTGAPAGDSAPGPLTPQQLGMIAAAAALFGVSFAAFVERVACRLPGVSGLADLDGPNFDLLMDMAVAAGFRHPALPLVSAEQRQCLDAARRQLGLSRRDLVGMLRHSTGERRASLMTGTHFLAVMDAFEQRGADVWFPAPGFVDRARASALRRAAWRGGLAEEELRGLLMHFGGCTRLRGLDARAYSRVMMAVLDRGGRVPAPAPRAAAEPGMATQAQVNVLWHAWHEARGDLDVSEASLDLAIELLLHFPGGVATLTRAGARHVTDAVARCRGNSAALMRSTFAE